ncbi:hypothetical protein BLA60_17075 [Actinophytocola xinjiangensis]|uniref:Thioester domain-containing protein n=1 Tax=Actinophytocola xinjiangensis TaxID=485602 RepID=A0A7Z0WPW8_9PSEU|nr:hypothetical protein BLA60_17075 [Actinophytocola xinjiangensis]
MTGLLLVGAPTASADVRIGLGHETRPAQPYANNPDAADWIGSYVVGGDQVWCVQFAYLAPDTNEQYQPGQQLRTKWGTPLPADVASDISYLLLRYADTDSADEAAALAHLLHSWTSGPQNPAQLDPSNDFRHIAYDAPFHLAKLPAGAKAAVAALTEDAAANRGPWTASVAAPDGAQTIGTPGEWTFEVLNAAGSGVGAVPVTVTAAGATFTDPTTGEQVGTATIPTPEDGAPVTVEVTPTSEAPEVEVTLAAPAAVPVVRQAVDVDTQRVVSTGGEEELVAAGDTTASPPPTTTTVTTTTTPPEVPSTIPAGESPRPAAAQAALTDTPTSSSLILLGIVAVVAAVFVALLLAHLPSSRRGGRHLRRR